MKLSPATTASQEWLREVGIPGEHVSSGELCSQVGTPSGVRGHVSLRETSPQCPSVMCDGTMDVACPCGTARWSGMAPGCHGLVSSRDLCPRMSPR